MVEGHLDREAAGIGDQPVRRLVAHDPAPGCGDADRAALIAADRHRHVAGGERRGAPLRRAAGRMGGLARIAHRAVAAGMAAAGEGEVGAGGLADDGGAGVEQAGDDGGVDGRHVAFQGARAVHHRQPRHRDHVLDADRLAGERAGVGALDLGPPVPGVVGVVVRVRAVAGRARIGHRWALLRHVVDVAQVRDRAPHGVALVGEVVERHVEPEIRSDLGQLVDGRQFRTARHGGLGSGRGGVLATLARRRVTDNGARHAAAAPIPVARSRRRGCHDGSTMRTDLARRMPRAGVARRSTCGGVAMSTRGAA